MHESKDDIDIIIFCNLSTRETDEPLESSLSGYWNVKTVLPESKYYLELLKIINFL